MDLAPLLQNRRWIRRELPFPYVHAMDVFQPSAYRDLAEAFAALLARGYGAADEHDRFSRGIEGYDVHAMSLQRSMPAPLHVFFSRAFHDAIAGVAGIQATLDVNGALHHHPAGSLSGRPHNDLNPGWFLDESPPGEVNLSDPRRCSYHSGQTFGTAAGETARETVRAAACLFYLSNPPWQAGDGGETGLYTSPSARTESPVAAVPPLNNSLLLFECTPRSYHAFIRNSRSPRNAVVLWIHRRKEEVVSRFGAGAIVGWDGPRVLNEQP